MTENLVTAAYIVSAVLFVLALAGLARHESAKEGNSFGVAGMVIALVATIWLAVSRSSHGALTVALIAAAMAIGAAIGLWRARVVQMTQMPELVAMLHSFVGLAAVLVGYNSFLEPGAGATSETIHLVEVFLGVFIGAVTFTGSIVAFLKLSARIRSAPLMLPARHWLNLAALVASAALLAWFLGSHSIVPLLVMTVIALASGVRLVYLRPRTLWLRSIAGNRAARLFLMASRSAPPDFLPCSTSRSRCSTAASGDVRNRVTRF